MKKKLLNVIAFSFIGIASYAQVQLDNTGSLLSFNKSPEFIENVAGSQYETEGFKSAHVNEGTQSFLIRYNNYKDLMEYKKDAKTILELIPEHNKTIKFSDGELYILKTYPIDKKETKEGYLKIIEQGDKVSLYSSTRVKYNKGTKAQNSYDTDRPSTFSKEKTKYFLEVDGKIQNISKAKDVRKILESKDDEIKNYLKKNDVELDEASANHFIKFLNSIL